MSGRKIPTGYARGAVVTKLPPEYVEAVNVMSEATMLRACELVLSDRDYKQAMKDQSKEGDEAPGSLEGSKSEEMEVDDTNKSEKSVSRMSDKSVGAATGATKNKSDYEQILDLYSKCKTAFQVIQKHQPSATAAAAAAPGLATMPKSPMPPMKRGKVGLVSRGMVGLPKLKPKTGMAPPPPMRRTGPTAPRTISNKSPSSPMITNSGIVKRKLISKERSDSSINSQGSGSKKVRLDGPPPAPPSLSGTESLPPPNALDFLAKLNNSKSTTSLSSAAPAPTPTPAPKVDEDEEDDAIGDDEVEEEDEELEEEEDDDDDGDDSNDDDASETKSDRRRTRKAKIEPPKRRKNPPRGGNRRR